MSTMRRSIVAVLYLAAVASLAPANLFAQQAPPPPVFESRTLKFRVISDAQTADYTYRARYEGGEGSLYVVFVVGAEMDVFVPSDANISSNAAAVGDRASLKPGREFTVTRFIALSNGIVANDLKVRSGLVISEPVAGIDNHRRWARPAGKAAAGLQARLWGEIKKDMGEGR